jgi:hypothetical protein
MLNLPQKPQFCQTDVSGSTFINADCFDVFPFIDNVLRLCVCLPLAQSFKLPQMLMGQIAQNRCYTLARLIKR